MSFNFTGGVWSSRPSLLTSGMVLAMAIPLLLFVGAQIGLVLNHFREDRDVKISDAARAIKIATELEVSKVREVVSMIALGQAAVRGDFDDMDRGLRRVLSQLPMISDFRISDIASGRVIVDTALPLGSRYPIDDTIRKENEIVAQSRTAAISDVQSSDVAVRQPFIAVSAPILRDGSVAQVITARIRAQKFESIFARLHVDQRWTAAIIDNDLRILARNKDSESFVGRRITPTLEANIVKNEKAVFLAISQDGQEVYTGVDRSQSIGWIVALGVPADDFDKPLVLTVLLMKVSGILALSAGGFIILWIVRKSRAIREQELRFQSELQTQVAEITRNLHEREQQLFEAQKLEAIGKLTGGMAHDFNNYLGVIVGNLDLLKEAKKLDDASEKLLDGALNGALKGAELTRSLLAFSRRQPLDSQVVDLNSRIRATKVLLGRTLGEDINVAVDLAEDLKSASLDVAQFDSCLVNLAMNARDAMPNGGGLYITTRNIHLDDARVVGGVELQGGDYVNLEVSDTGIGIPDEFLDRIWEPFFTTKEVGKGTGLGLSMVYGFVKQSGGSISVDSSVGRGTTFRIFFPAVATERRNTNPPTQQSSRGGNETILVVEDNDELRASVVAQLNSLGYNVLVASSAYIGLDILGRERSKIDLVFSDVLMPGGLDGYQLARIAINRVPGIRILMTSGFPGDAAVRENRPRDIAFLAKPYRREQLAKAIRDVLDAVPSVPVEDPA